MSFIQRAKTPKNTNDEYFPKNGEYLNTFNKTNYSSFGDKMKMMNNYKCNNYYKPNQFNSFFKSSAPFNYYHNMNDRDRLLVRYNGGPQKEYNSFITRDNLSHFLRKKNNSNRYKRPCGCYSKYNITKYSQVLEHPQYDREYQYGNYNRGQKLPLIGDNDNNLRYSYTNGLMTPDIKNKRIGKLTCKLKDNYDSENYPLNNESNNLANNQNACENDAHENVNVNVNENINQNENNEAINDVKEEEKNENIEKKVSNGNTIFIMKNNNCFNIKPRRRFHKVQIFNNYKPFLVDDFKEYGFFE